MISGSEEVRGFWRTGHDHERLATEELMMSTINDAVLNPRLEIPRAPERGAKAVPAAFPTGHRSML